MAGADAGQFLPRGPRLQRQSNSPPWVAGVVLKLILGERVPVCLPLSFQTSPLCRASVRADISATTVPERGKSLKRKVMRYLGGGIAGAARRKTFRSCYAARAFRVATQKIHPRQSNVSGTESTDGVREEAFPACRAHLNEGVQNWKHA